MSVTPRQAQIERARRAAMRDLKSFVLATWPILNPGVPLITGWAFDAICEHVQAWVIGDIRYLLVEVPPGSSKSTIGSQCAPAWSWMADTKKYPTIGPSTRWMCGSYNDQLAHKFNRDRRALVRSHQLRKLMRHRVHLDTGEKAAGFFTNTDRGFMMSMSPRSGATGLHCDRMVIDDPLKPSEATSTGLAEVEKWQRTTLPSRFRAPGSESMLLIMQRLAEGDPADIMREMYPDAVSLTIPALHDPSRSTVTVLGYKDPRKKADESFFPERFSVETIKAKKVQLGSMQFSAQYQQTPVSAEGNLIKVDRFHRWTRLPDLKGAQWVASVDSTFSNGDQADFVAVQIWAAIGAVAGHSVPRAYLVEQVHARLDFVETKEAILALQDRFPLCRRWLIEAGRAANGDALVSDLRRSMPGIVPTSYNRGQTKEGRVIAITGFVESGNVSVPADHVAGWAGDFVKECAGFPRMRHDDQVDAMSMALLHLSRYLMPGQDLSAALVDVDRGRSKKPQRRTFYRG